MYFSKLVVFWMAIVHFNGAPYFELNQISIEGGLEHTYNGVDYRNVHVSKKECEEFIKIDKLIYEEEIKEGRAERPDGFTISLQCMAFAQDVPWQLGNKYRQITDYQRIKERIPLVYEPDEFSTKKWSKDTNGKGIIVNNKRFDN